MQHGQHIAIGSCHGERLATCTAKRFGKEVSALPLAQLLFAGALFRALMVAGIVCPGDEKDTAAKNTAARTSTRKPAKGKHDESPVQSRRMHQ
jgi:hypothetical protein